MDSSTPCLFNGSFFSIGAPDNSVFMFTKKEPLVIRLRKKPLFSQVIDS